MVVITVLQHDLKFQLIKLEPSRHLSIIWILNLSFYGTFRPNINIRAITSSTYELSVTYCSDKYLQVDDLNRLCGPCMR